MKTASWIKSIYCVAKTIAIERIHSMFWHLLRFAFAFHLLINVVRQSAANRKQFCVVAHRTWNSESIAKMKKLERVEALQEYFKSHNKSKEQKAHASKVHSYHNYSPIHRRRCAGCTRAQVMCELPFTASQILCNFNLGPFGRMELWWTPIGFGFIR